MKKLRLFIGAGLIYIGTAAGTYFWFRSRDHEGGDDSRGETNSAFLSRDDKRSLYASLADTYDSKISLDEDVLLISRMRRSLIARAEGRVLEIAGGTGRNLPYYDLVRTAVVVTDNSEHMLQVGRDKAERIGRTSEDSTHAGSKGGGSNANGTSSSPPRLSFELQDAEHLRYGDSEFDTVVDTFGLCSVDDPTSVLAEIQRVCKPGGYVLLLEHGLSSWAWLRRLQIKSSRRHYLKWGCIFDRDINQLMENSGLKIVSTQRWHLGTTYVVIATPNKTV